MAHIQNYFDLYLPTFNCANLVASIYVHITAISSFSFIFIYSLSLRLVGYTTVQGAGVIGQ